MAVRESQQALFTALREAEAQGTRLSQADILTATGWREPTLRTYLGKGQLSDFLVEVAPNEFEVANVSRLSLGEFAKRLTQSKHIRGLGHKLESRLARALLTRSRDNMMLALELYNRPFLANRLDGFALLFTTAWDQLIKARVIEKDGEDAIFMSGPAHGRHRATYHIRHHLQLLYKETDPVRRNLERIVFYRDEAAHLLMPELQPVVSRLFQAGILNYAKQFEDFAGQPFLPPTAVGLLSLVGDMSEPKVAMLRSNYGAAIGDEVMALATTLEEDIRTANDGRFAIPVDIKLIFAKKNEDGGWIQIADSASTYDDLRKAVVIAKPVDREATHPYTEADAIARLMELLRAALSPEDLGAILVARKDGHAILNAYCFRAMVWKQKWRNANNEFHYKNTKPEYHYYSEEAVDTLAKRMAKEPGWLAACRDSYTASMQKKKNKKK